MLRKLIHTRNRFKYRRVFREMMGMVRTEHELDLLRKIDYNSDNFCYSQVDPVYVGTGISDSPVEKIHDITKSQITESTKYTKVVHMILHIVEDRNNYNTWAYPEPKKA